VAAAALLRARPSYYLAERLLLYVTITTVVYYWTSVSVASPWDKVETAYFGLLSLALLVSYRFARNRNFTVTPTDFLIIFIALAAPTLSGSVLPEGGVGTLVIKVLVLFYAAELVISHAGRHTWVLRAGVLGVLALLVVRVINVLPP
jgi:UDP-GlcNAc:undecaprenyl-phosphate GlcNAc-1-phosphate transferase